MNRVRKLFLYIVVLFGVIFPICIIIGVMNIALADSFGYSCRSIGEVNKFRKANPCPQSLIKDNKCKGIVDHICALDVGGRDDYKVNMQWQSYPDSKIKDRIELTDLGRIKFCTPQNSTPTRQVFNCKRK